MKVGGTVENGAKREEEKTKVTKKVVVEIFGETYKLKTDGDPQYLMELAKLVDEKMREISQKAKIFSGGKIGVLAALELADEYSQLKKDYDELMALFDDT